MITLSTIVFDISFGINYGASKIQVQFGGIGYSSGEDQTTYYLMKIISKPGFKIIKEIPMSMTKKDYINACKKLTELKEI